MNFRKKNLLLIIFLINFLIGILILYFWGENQIEFLMGYLIALIGYIFLAFWIFKKESSNKLLKNPIFLIGVFFAIRILFMTKVPIPYLDFEQYYYPEVLRMLNGEIPIIDFGYYGITYYLLLYIPTIISNGNYYFIKFFFILIEFGCVILIYLIANHLKPKNKYKIVCLYIFSPFFFVDFGWFMHNDPGVVLFVLISIYLLLKNKILFSSIFLGLAILHKFYPIVIIPVYILYLIKKDNKFKIRFYNLIKFLIPYVLVAIIFMIFYSDKIIILINGFVTHFSRVPIWSFAQIISLLFQNNYGLMIFYIFLITVFLILKQSSTKSEIILIGIITAVFSFLIFILPNPFNLFLSIPLWLFIFDKGKYYKISIASNVIAIGFCSVFYTFTYNNFLVFIPYIFLSIIGILLLYILINYLKYKNPEKKDFMYLIISVLLVFVTFFWVQYPRYYLWVLPLILIFYKNNWINKFLIIFIPFFIMIGYYIDTGFFTAFAGPYIGNFGNSIIIYIQTNIFYSIITLIFLTTFGAILSLYFLKIFLYNKMKKNIFYYIVNILIIPIMLVPIILYSNIYISSLNAYYFAFDIYMISFFIVRKYLKTPIFSAKSNYNRVITNIFLIILIVDLLCAIYLFNIISSIFSSISIFLIIYGINKIKSRNPK